MGYAVAFAARYHAKRLLSQKILAVVLDGIVRVLQRAPTRTSLSKKNKSVGLCVRDAAVIAIGRDDPRRI